MSIQQAAPDGDVVRVLKEHAAAEILRARGIALDELQRGSRGRGTVALAVLQTLAELDRENERLRGVVAGQARTIEMLRAVTDRE